VSFCIVVLYNNSIVNMNYN